jgi:NAD(P)-dependent dehydrogenase (short-subunit alcohol dehydrogenase family)
LVTGAASGIGAACAAMLAREGATGVATDIDDAVGTGQVRRITVRGHKAIYLHQDVTQEEEWRDLVAEIEHRAGRLDILNAGIGIDASSIVDMSLTDWQRQTAVNLWSGPIKLLAVKSND